ncbi:hypothetical protein MSAN_00045500 [Mycena sanguinolenta]|uniref:C2H2-type domain-containing protein n=1 Tax=Mycena sanguinolenta TaxID=230812 RepID=A0A8H7DM62_9AGAR|nr:hypothetical protein MSAN_00045500 [Mycena sanguinolenta]
MIATCSVTPFPSPSLPMSSSSDSGRSRRSHDHSPRPVLPPIRDLFRELSSSRPPPESPALTLARLRVSDEEDPRHTYGSPQSRPSSTRPYESKSSQHDPRGSRGPYPMTDFQNPPLRTMSYDRAVYPPATSYPVHRNSVPTYDPRSSRPPFDHHQSQPPYYPQLPSNAMPPMISTGIYGSRGEDDDRTPVARYQPSGLAGFAPPDASTSTGGPAKYECNYCGKGFSRPSSLRIHLNSHTGEKPFVCPVDGCGRSFSVLSNMRRHARVHTTPITPPGSGAPPLANSSHPSYNAMASAGKWKHRRNSSASASSSSSRRSHSVSSDDEEEEDRSKRTRHQRK